MKHAAVGAYGLGLVALFATVRWRGGGGEDKRERPEQRRRRMMAADDGHFGAWHFQWWET